MSSVAKRAASKPIVMSESRKIALTVRAEEAWEREMDKARPHGNRKPKCGYAEAVLNARLAYDRVIAGEKESADGTGDEPQSKVKPARTVIKKVSEHRVTTKKVTHGVVTPKKVTRGTVASKKVLEGRA